MTDFLSTVFCDLKNMCYYVRIFLLSMFRMSLLWLLLVGATWALEDCDRETRTIYLEKNTGREVQYFDLEGSLCIVSFSCHKEMFADKKTVSELYFLAGNGEGGGDDIDRVCAYVDNRPVIDNRHSSTIQSLLSL